MKTLITKLGDKNTKKGFALNLIIFCVFLLPTLGVAGMTFVWDIDNETGLLGCYPEDPRHPGYSDYYGLQGYSVDRSFCDRYPGSLPGGHPTFVWDRDNVLGFVGCFLEDGENPGHSRQGTRQGFSVSPSLCRR